MSKPICGWYVHDDECVHLQLHMGTVSRENVISSAVGRLDDPCSLQRALDAIVTARAFNAGKFCMSRMQPTF